MERKVDKIIGAKSLLWLAINDNPGPGNRRSYIESNSISLLSNYDKKPLDPPSDRWLGHYSDKPLVRQSGLWNQQHTDKKYDPTFLDTLERLIDEMKSNT